VWEALPAVGAALVEYGPDLIDRFVPGEALLRRAEGFPSPTGASHWQAHLRQIVGRGGIGTLAQTASGLGASSSQPDLFAQVTQVLHALSLRRPLLLQVDDLQWADGGTAALLFHLGRRLSGSRILLVGAFRPQALVSEQGSQGRASGIGVVLQELRREWGEVLVDLDQADGRAFVEAYLDSKPNRLGQGFRQALYEHTEGNPLFTVELLRRFERDGTLVQDEEGKWVEAAGPDWERWPPQVEAVIAGHLAGLADEDLALLQAASVQGEQFVAEAAARVVGLGEDSVLRRLGGSLRSKHRLVEAVSLERLEGSGQRLSRYRFRHSLLQRSAYRSLDPAVRAGLHEMTGRALEAMFASPDAKLAGEGPQLLMTELAPELARHFEEAGLPLDAARHRMEAGRWAARLVAYDESIAHLERGLALLEETKSSRERLRLELSLWTAMVNPALLQGGWRSLSYRQAMDRLSILAQHPDLCGDPQTVSALAMLALTVAWSADPLRGRQLGEQLLGQAHDGDEQTLMLANWVRGHSYFWQGDLAAAYVNLSQALALHGQKAGRPLSLVLNSDPRVVGLAMLGYLRWLLGYPDQGQDSFQQALSQAQAIAQPPTTAFVHVMVGMAHFILGRNAGAAHSHGAALQTLSQEGLFYHGFVEVLAARDGQTGEVEPELVPDRGAASGRGTSLLTVGTGTGQTGRFLVQAHMCAQAGRFALALQALDEAQAWIDETGVKILEAEVWRMRGELLLARSESDGAGEAEVCFRRALELASTQQARWLELRAAVSLARLWQRQGRREDALDLLTGIYNWFTEGFDTVDLVEAKQLWQELG